MHNTKIARPRGRCNPGPADAASADSNVTVYGLIDLNVGYEGRRPQPSRHRPQRAPAAAALASRVTRIWATARRRCSCSKADSTHPPAPPSRAAGSTAARPTSVSKGGWGKLTLGRQYSPAFYASTLRSHRQRRSHRGPAVSQERIGQAWL